MAWRWLALLGTMTVAWPAHAEWRSARQVTLGTAQVLEQGELSFGVLAMPVAFGLTPRLTLQTHPLLDLLLVPNLAGRYKLPFEGSNWLISLTGDFRRSFFFGASTTSVRPSTADGRPCNVANDSGYGSQTAAACITPGDSPPGQLTAGLSATWYPHEAWALSFSPLYAARLGGVAAADCTETGGCGSWHHGVGVGVQAHVVLRSTDLLAASAFLRYDVDTGSQAGTGPGMDVPAGELVWAHQFRDWLADVHLIVGMSFGRFGLRDYCGTACTSNWPVFPLVDLWWRR